MANDWFETVAEAQRRAKARLPKSVYGALIAGSEKGLSTSDNLTSFDQLGFAPHVAGNSNSRDMSTTVMGQSLSMPVIISPTGVQAVHPQGEVAIARAAANRGIPMGLSSFASKSVEDVAAVNDSTLFQMYWCGDRATLEQRRNVLVQPVQKASSLLLTGHSVMDATGEAHGFQKKLT